MRDYQIFKPLFLSRTQVDKKLVSVMIVGNGEFWGIPWDLIIRRYRQKHKEGFQTLRGYAESILDFAKELGEEYIEFFSIHTKDIDPSTELIFAGYAKGTDRPSILRVTITGCYLGRISAEYDREVTVTDERHGYILSYGDTGIIDSLKNGIGQNYTNQVHNLLDEKMACLLKKVYGKIDANKGDERWENLRKCMDDIGAAKLIEDYDRSVLGIRKEREDVLWTNSIASYNLTQMASLAENLVYVTELHKKLLTQPETVGGLIDLAIITREDGFQWLNRKSWYQPSVGGQYGRFGV